MSYIFKKNRDISQKLKPITIERMSYFIQFAIGTETVKILTIHKISQASGQIIAYLSEWRERD